MPPHLAVDFKWLPQTNTSFVWPYRVRQRSLTLFARDFSVGACDKPIELDGGRVVQESQVVSRAEVRLDHVGDQAGCVKVDLLKYFRKNIRLWKVLGSYDCKINGYFYV